MAFSKETRLKIFIVIDIIFFLLEIIVGYTAHSLALVADAFHMLNDVISLCVGLWAVRVATTRGSSPQYTYGWARAEIIGGLVNGVFLVALCVSIVLDAINRFFEPQEVNNPKLVLIVGGIGLAFNILGLFVFHQHDHGHDHGHEEDHEHAEDTLGTAEEGHAGHSHGTAEEHIHAKTTPALEVTTQQTGRHSRKKDHSVSWSTDAVDKTSFAGRQASINSRRARDRRARSGSRSYTGIEDSPIHPAFLRNEIIESARRSGQPDDSESEIYSDPEVDQAVEESRESSEVQPLLGKGRTQKSYSTTRISYKAFEQGDPPSHGSNDTHHGHKHRQPRPKAEKGGHSHADMNIRGIFLHVLGDALGNVGVMASALIIWLTAPWEPRFYFDPIISLFITVIILWSAIPLCLNTSKPLLQAVPSHISIDDIRADIEDLGGVQSCHHLHVWALTPSKLIATLDVELDFESEHGGFNRWMKLATDIKKCLHEHGVHNSTIQPEFYCPPNPAGVAVDATGESSSSDTVVENTNPSRQRRPPHACLLDCPEGCEPDKSCCESKPGSGATTPNNEHSHGHGHGSGQHGHR